MSTLTKIPGEFVGRIGTLIFTDRQAFEKAVPTYLGLSRHRTTFKVGETVYLDYDGRTVTAQVWSDGPAKGSYWVRGNDGVTYLIGRKTGEWRPVTPTNSFGSALSDSDVRDLRKRAAA